MSTATPDAARFALPIPTDRLGAFCRRWRVVRLELFGSVLRPADFRPDSDVDVMVTFEPPTEWTLWSFCDMQDELVVIVGRPVDLMTRRSVEQSTNQYRREPILGSAVVVYAQ